MPNLQNILMEEFLIKGLLTSQTFLLQSLYADFYLYSKSCILKVMPMPSATPAAGHRMMTPPSGATVEMGQQPSGPTMFSKSIVAIDLFKFYQFSFVGKIWGCLISKR